jgi:hypothetical protein
MSFAFEIDNAGSDSNREWLDYTIWTPLHTRLAVSLITCLLTAGNRQSCFFLAGLHSLHCIRMTHALVFQPAWIECTTSWRCRRRLAANGEQRPSHTVESRAPPLAELPRHFNGLFNRFPCSMCTGVDQ